MISERTLRKWRRDALLYKEYPVQHDPDIVMPTLSIIEEAEQWYIECVETISVWHNSTAQHELTCSCVAAYKALIAAIEERK